MPLLHIFHSLLPTSSIRPLFHRQFSARRLRLRLEVRIKLRKLRNFQKRLPRLHPQIRQAWHEARTRKKQKRAELIKKHPNTIPVKGLNTKLKEARNKARKMKGRRAPYWGRQGDRRKEFKDVETFFKAIGKGAEAHISDFTSIEQVKAADSRKLKALGVKVKTRKWILRWTNIHKQAERNDQRSKIKATSS